MNGARQLSFWAAGRDCSGQCGRNTLENVELLVESIVNIVGSRSGNVLL